MSTLHRSAISNSCKRRSLPLDTDTPFKRLDEISPVVTTNKSNKDASTSMNAMDRWDEARVGFKGAEKDAYRPGNVIQRGIGAGIGAVKRRRSNRALYIIISFLSISAWFWISSSSLTADVTAVSAYVSANGTGLTDRNVADSRSFRFRLMDCLSFKECPWLFHDTSDTKSIGLSMDEEYLEPEHLALPRLNEPYPNIDEWSIEKKQKTLKGLEWLLAHYNDRWQPEPALKGARRFNQDVFSRLHDCLQTSLAESVKQSGKRFGKPEKPVTCSQQEMTIVLLGSYHFGAVHIGWVSGEDIWARSLMATMDDLGYSLLYAYDTAEIYDIYRAIPDLVQIVIAQTSNIRECKVHGVYELSKVLTEPDIRQGGRIMFVQAQEGNSEQVRNHTWAEWQELRGEPEMHWKNPVYYGHPRLYGHRKSDSPNALNPESPEYEPHEEWHCAQSPEFPHGIPLWKMFGFHFWENTDEHPLGAQWTLSPEPYATFPSVRHKPDHNMYMGYSVEAYCGDVVPVEERDHRAYILAKEKGYFEPPRFTFSDHVFSDMKRDLGVDFVAGIGKTGSVLPDEGISNLGFMSLPDFQTALGRSKVLVGVGRPRLSPTPYDALCMGVPFINSILDWDRKRPDDQTAWYSQHEGLINVGEPYVYNVKQGNETEFKEAIAKAFASPIDRFIPRGMSKPAMKARHRLLVEADWRQVYEERFGGQGDNQEMR